MFRAFSLAIDLNLGLSLRTRELIGEHAASAPAVLREDPDAGSRFIELLCDQRDTANPSRLEQMQDLAARYGSRARQIRLERYVQPIGGRNELRNGFDRIAKHGEERAFAKWR